MLSHTASPEDPEVWLPPSRQSSFTRASAASDDDSAARLAPLRPRSSGTGAHLLLRFQMLSIHKHPVCVWCASASEPHAVWLRLAVSHYFMIMPQLRCTHEESPLGLHSQPHWPTLRGS